MMHQTWMNQHWWSLSVLTLVASCGGAFATSESGSGGGGGTSAGGGAGQGGSSGVYGKGGANTGFGGAMAGGTAGKGGGTAGGGITAKGGSFGMGGVSGAGTGGIVVTGGAVGSGGTTGGSCTDPDGLAPDTKTTATGTNGSFTDSCDQSANLIEYYCEFVYDPGCFPNPDPGCGHFTGAVLARNIDCAGNCLNGACVARCPRVGDSLQYLSVDVSGNAGIKNLRDSRSYQCTLLFDAMGGINCKAVASGLSATVYSLGLSDQYCTAAAFGNIGVSVGTSTIEDCAYSCTILG